MCITKSEAKFLVDKAADLNVKGKEIEKELKLIKSQLKEYAEKNKLFSIPGINHVCVFTKNPINYISPTSLFKLMTKLKLREKFFDCVKVGMENTRKVVPEHELEKIQETTIDEWGKCSFK